MPSPLGHALGGAIAGLLTARRGTPAPQGRRVRLVAELRTPVVTIAALAACLPDIDFLWGRHNMETHSVGVALAVGLLTWAVARNARLAVAVTLAWTSHVAFDWLGSDDTAPLGVMALWPVSHEFFFAHAYVFEAISRRYWLPGFVAHNLWAMVSELLMLGPVAFGVAAARVWREPRRPAG